MTTIYTSDNGWPAGVPDTGEVAYIGYRRGTDLQDIAQSYRERYGIEPPWIVVWRGWPYVPEPKRKEKA